MRVIHEAAAKGFETAGDAYERGRPDYPPEAIGWLERQLGLERGMTVVDLGAGTGKLTRLLLARGYRVLAVEPVAGMRARLARHSPGAEIVEGTAEATTLADGTADAVVAAQAFHWFDGARALAEIRRVLRPGGGLGLLWNVRDDSVDWVARLTGLMDAYEGGAPRRRSGEWRACFERTSLFTPLREGTFRHAKRLTPELAVDLVVSVSFIAALPEAEREEVALRVRALLATHPETAGRTELELPYRVDAFACAGVWESPAK